MSSLLDLIVNQPSLAEQYYQMVGLQGIFPRQRSGPGFPTRIPQGVLYPDDPNLVTRMGVTLARPAMRSLVRVARQSDVLPGIQELRHITDSYRTPEQQAALYARKPGLAAPPGKSLHQRGLAIDWGWAVNHPEIIRLLEQYGWHRFDPSKEPWHWSYGIVG
jgi:hypothetical protein